MIQQLYFVRATICAFLQENGFKKPWQILLAQLHPKEIFGFDIFDEVFQHIMNGKYGNPVFGKPYPYPFCAIDEIQISVETRANYTLAVPGNMRPFFSPLVLFSKLLNIFPLFILSGTGINFELVKEAMESSTMKDLVNDYETISCFHPLSKSEIELYAHRYLVDHNVADAVKFVSRITSFELCHGRPRFLAYILDGFMESRDIDVAVGKFILALSRIDSNVFPLRFFKRDLDNNEETLKRVIGNDTLLTIIRNGLLDAIWKGSVVLDLTDEASAAAIRYGLGFGEVSEGMLHAIKIEELAVVECLRYMVPFSYIIDGFAQRMNSCPNPQTVGYLLDYLVAFALVSQFSGKKAAMSINSSHSLASQYLRTSDVSQVYFPDHMCGPDIIYKCIETKTVYIVQVKFVKGSTKQEAANARDTTDPNLFYHKRKSDGILKGFESKRQKLLEELKNLQKDKFSLQQILFIHSGKNRIPIPTGVLIVTKQSHPDFFSTIGANVWDFLDSVRNNFQQVALE